MVSIPSSFACGTAYPTLGKKIKMMKKNRRMMNKKDPKRNRTASVAPSKVQARHDHSIHFCRGKIVGEPFQSVVFGAVSYLLEEQSQGAQ